MANHQQLRSDAVRNRKRIVRAARKQLTSHGLDTGMAQIAARAGVAVGTLYRNFPTKAHLVDAVVRDLSETLLADLEATVVRVEAGAPAHEQFRALALRCVETAAASPIAAAAARALDGAGDTDAGRRYHAALERLVGAGHAAGALRPDATAEDVRLMVLTVPTAQPPAVRRRWLQLVLDGMTAGAPTRP